MVVLKFYVAAFLPVLLFISALEPDLSPDRDPEIDTQPNVSLLELISMTQQLSEFHELIQIADMDDLLQDGPVTLFIPVNNAFNALSEELMEEYRQDEEALRELLGQHMYEGELISQFFSDGQELEMVNGQTAIISISPMGYEINNVNIIQIDVEATNGLIHIVNEVIFPGEN